MNEPGQVPPQRLPQANPHAPAAPRPAGAGPAQPARAPIQPPPMQPARVQPVPAQPVHAQPGHAPPPRLPTQGGHSPAPGRLAPISLDDEDGDLINLDDDDAPAATAAAAHAPPAASQSHVAVGQASMPSKIKVNTGGDKHTYHRFKRDVTFTGKGATRVRSFHGRLSDDGLAYTDDKINEWLDSHPEVEVKHVNCIVGPLEGKVTGEQGLIVVIWY